MPHHPFAAVQHTRSSLSTDNLPIWLRHEMTSREIPPVPPVPRRAQPRSPSNPPPIHRQRMPHTNAPSRPSVDVDVPSAASRGSPGHFVKHSSRCTLLLSGQEEGAKIPQYTTGGTIDGILAVPRPAGLLSLQVTVGNFNCIE